MAILTPFLSFLDRYSLAVDNMAQYEANPSSLIWGLLRIVIRSLNSSIGGKVGRLGDQLKIYNRFEQTFGDDMDFKISISDTYLDCLNFVRLAKDTVQKPGSCSVWIGRAWKNFESEFEDISDRLSQRFEYLGLLTTNLHCERANQDRRDQHEYRIRTEQTLDGLAKHLSCPSSSVTTGIDPCNVHPPINGTYTNLDVLAKRRQEIIDWLAPTDWIGDLLRVQKKHSVESGRWLTKHNFFEELTDSNGCTSPIGWVHGNAGVGKTALAATAIGHLTTTQATHKDSSRVAYFFWDSTDESRNGTLDMYKAVITQLICAADSIPSSVKGAFDQARNYGRTRFAWADKPSDVLKTLLDCPRHTFLVLDALDECEDIEDTLTEFTGVIESVGSCRTLMFSRDVPTIRQGLKNATILKVTPSLTKEDVDVYLATAIPKLPIQDRETRLRVHHMLSDQADGMFLWVNLKIAELKLAVSTTDVLKMLNKPPEALGSTYQRALRTMAQAHPTWFSLTIRRRAWLTRWLFAAKEESPLQRMLKLIREVRLHLEAYQSGLVSFDELDDVLDVLVDFDIARLYRTKDGDHVTLTKISHFERLTVVRELAREYMIAGRLSEGICHIEQCIRRIQNTPSTAPPDWSWLLSGLGIMHDQDENRELALEKLLEVLEIQESSDRQDPFEIALTRNDIGRLYRHLGQWDESEKMHLGALEPLYRIFPDNDLQVAWTQNTLARCYRKQGRLDEAIELHSRALESQKALIGLEHPHTLWALSDIAKCYGDKGDFIKACELQKESLKLREKVLGPLHHDYLWALNDLGILFEKARQFREAVNVHNIALKGQKQILESCHKTVLCAVHPGPLFLMVKIFVDREDRRVYP
ncbi:C2H2 domain-containing protein [Apiospora kogelbergensis]|uniref:C2H2 domain-containing protein n=1 Tax=Apiospora kogelbergensis TaxID=1337665 RepID=UPI00312E6BB2